MPAIYDLIPDPEMLLNLEPEELGGVLLAVYAGSLGSGDLFGHSLAVVAQAKAPSSQRSLLRISAAWRLAAMASMVRSPCR